MSSWISVGVAAVLAVITAYYAWEARQARRISRDQLDTLVRPIITATLVLRHSHMMYLRVANDGHSPASDLRLAIDRELPPIPGIPALGQLALFSDGAACVPPGAQYFFVLGGAPMILEDASAFPLRFGVDATYMWKGRQESERAIVDVGSFKGSQAAPRTEAEAIENLTDKLKEALKKLE